jgi:hypothetical protein
VSARGQGQQLDARNPALRACVQQAQGFTGKVEVHSSREGCYFIEGKAQFASAYFAQLIARSQACQSSLIEILDIGT